MIGPIFKTGLQIGGTALVAVGTYVIGERLVVGGAQLAGRGYKWIRTPNPLKVVAKQEALAAASEAQVRESIKAFNTLHPEPIQAPVAAPVQAPAISAELEAAKTLMAQMEKLLAGAQKLAAEPTPERGLDMQSRRQAKARKGNKQGEKRA